MDTQLKASGYTMVCIDGWGDVSQLNENGYRLSHSRHWQHDYAWWSRHLQDRGLTLGMYGNPLWIHVADDDSGRLIVKVGIAPVKPAEFVIFRIQQKTLESVAT